MTAVAAIAVTLTLGATSASAAEWRPVAVWHMDETSGTRMVDAVGHNTGTTTDVTMGLPGPARHAYGYNGESSQVFVPSADALNPGDRDIRLTIWIKTTRKPEKPDWDLFRKGWYTREKALYDMEYQPGGHISCQFRGTKDSSEIKGGGPDLADGKWHKVSCTKTATSMTVTVDGRTAVAKEVTIGKITNTDPLVVGSNRHAEYFNGLLDEAVIEMAEPSGGRVIRDVASTP